MDWSSKIFFFCCLWCFAIGVEVTFFAVYLLYWLPSNFFFLLYLLFAKRSVVSAANYAERSSFAKDQIFVLLPIEVISHANEVFFVFFAYNQFFFCIQPTLSAFCQHIAAWQSLWSGFHTWILYNFHKIYCVTSQSIVFWWSYLVRRTVMSDINHIKARCCRWRCFECLNGGIS